MARTNEDIRIKKRLPKLAKGSVVKKANTPLTPREQATKAAGKLIEKDPAALDRWMRGLKGKPRG